MCLWALENYRKHAQRLAHPALLPLAKAVCELLSRNRFLLSDALFRQEPHNTARKVAAHYGLHKATLAGQARSAEFFVALSLLPVMKSFS